MKLQKSFIGLVRTKDRSIQIWPISFQLRNYKRKNRSIHSIYEGTPHARGRNQTEIEGCSPLPVLLTGCGRLCDHHASHPHHDAGSPPCAVTKSLPLPAPSSTGREIARGWRGWTRPSRHSRERSPLRWPRAPCNGTTEYRFHQNKVMDIHTL